MLTAEQALDQAWRRNDLRREIGSPEIIILIGIAVGAKTDVSARRNLIRRAYCAKLFISGSLGRSLNLLPASLKVAVSIWPLSISAWIRRIAVA